MKFCTELYKAVHRALSAIRNHGVSTFQGEVYTGRIGPIVGTLESVRIIEVSTRLGSTVYMIYCMVTVQQAQTFHSNIETRPLPK